MNFEQLKKLLCSLLLIASFIDIDAKSHPDYDSFNGLVMTGYQGWFNCPEDGSGKKWAHYSKGKQFEPGYCSIDFWPDMSEYEVKYQTAFTHEDDSPAYVFSSYDPSTVYLHFKWMSDYGIDGAFMQRFIHKLHDPKVENHYDRVFDSAIKAAKKHGRAISIRYDLTSMPPGYSKVLLDDLDKLNAQYDFFQRSDYPTFLHHDGKPLIAFGGIGFSDDVADDDVGYLEEAELVIAGLRARGYSIMMRVPAQWRDFGGTATVGEPEEQAKLHELCKSVDFVMPWHVGAYREASYVKNKWKQKIADDIAWCEKQGVEYVPVIYPGFSRANLKAGEDGSFRPRNKGSFFWLQASSALDAGADQFFVAQFDELDEGTQIFKCSQRPPVGSSPFIVYEDDVATDHYLWLTGKVGELLRGDVPFATELPHRTVTE